MLPEITFLLEIHKLSKNIKINQMRDNEYSEIIKNGTKKIDSIKIEIENEKKIQNQLALELSQEEDQTANIEQEAAKLRDKVS